MGHAVVTCRTLLTFVWIIDEFWNGIRTQGPNLLDCISNAFTMFFGNFDFYPLIRFIQVYDARVDRLFDVVLQ